MTVIKSTFTKFLDLPPSCVEICPWNDKYFAIGTYCLEKENSQTADGNGHGNSTAQKRSGSILIFSLNENRSEVQLEQTFTIDYAILDLHFSNHSRYLWTANSTGSLACYTIDDAKGLSIKRSRISQKWDQSILVLSFTFHPKDSKLLAATLSDGGVAVCRLSEDMNKVQSIYALEPHTLEAWTSAFALEGNYLFSGADDAVLQCVTLSNLTATENMTHALEWSSLRHHQAGVTAILEISEDIVLTGSYDDHIRILDVKTRPKLLVEVNLEGGVWRLKLMRSVRSPDGAKSFEILASCMHAGARIIRICLGEIPSITILARFEEHESMNYGSDFTQHNDNATILSTSFYDKRLCLWKYPAQDKKGDSEKNQALVI